MKLTARPDTMLKRWAWRLADTRSLIANVVRDSGGYTASVIPGHGVNGRVYIYDGEIYAEARLRKRGTTYEVKLREPVDVPIKGLGQNPDVEYSDQLTPDADGQDIPTGE